MAIGDIGNIGQPVLCHVVAEQGTEHETATALLHLMVEKYALERGIKRIITAIHLIVL